MLVYLDANCFNRPFDDQTQERIQQETEAVLNVLQRVLGGHDQLAWSAALNLELSAHPEPDIREELMGWAERCQILLEPSNDVRARAEALHSLGMGALDAAHIAFAEAGGCDLFLTCDDRLLRRSRRLALSVQVFNPVEYVEGIANAENAD